MGPIVFETNDVHGRLDVAIVDDLLQTDPPPTARIEIDLASLRSGNDVYDAELRRRLDTKRYPTCTLDLVQTSTTGSSRFALGGEITFHGTTRPITGTVEVDRSVGGRYVITGDKLIDIREFLIPSPGILLLKIYPEVEVRMFVEAAPDCQGDRG